MQQTESSEPNYASYTLDELVDARDHVDRGAYPGRYRQILAEIDRRGGRDDPDTGTVGRPPVFPLAGVTLAVVVLVLIAGTIAVVSIGPRTLAMMKFARPIQQSLSAEYDGQRMEVSIETADDGERHHVVVVLIDSKYAGSSRRREEKAKEIAAVALAAHPATEDVARVTVIYRKAVGSAAANAATDRRHSYSPDEL